MDAYQLLHLSTWKKHRHISTAMKSLPIKLPPETNPFHSHPPTFNGQKHV